MQLLEEVFAAGKTLDVLDILAEGLDAAAQQTTRADVRQLQARWNTNEAKAATQTAEATQIERNRIIEATGTLLQTLKDAGYKPTRKMRAAAKKALATHQKQAWFKQPWAKIGAGIVGAVTVIGLIITQVLPFWGITRVDQLWKPAFQPAFPSDASERDSVYVLVLNFKDIIHPGESKLSTDCAGEEILRQVNIMAFEEKMAIRAKYIDSIISPENPIEAKAIQKRHNADLVIFAFTKYFDNDSCKGDFNFRHAIDPCITAQFSSQYKADIQDVTIANNRYRPFGLEDDTRGNLMLGNLNLLPFLGVLLDAKLRLKKPTYERLGKVLHRQSMGEKPNYWDAIVAYYNLQDYDHALYYTNIMYKINKKNDSIFWAKGAIYKKKMIYDSAIIAFTDALKINKEPNYYYNRADIYKQQGDSAKALADMDSASSLNQNFSSSFDLAILQKYNTFSIYPNSYFSLMLNPSNDSKKYYVYNYKNFGVKYVSYTYSVLDTFDNYVLLRDSAGSILNCSYNKQNTFFRKNN